MIFQAINWIPTTEFMSGASVQGILFAIFVFSFFFPFQTYKSVSI